jgi:phosphoglycerate kinase
VRVDFDVPTEQIDETPGSDDTRIRESLPKIELLRAKGAKVIFLAHLRSPERQSEPEISAEAVADHLTKMIRRQYTFSPR